MVVLTIDPAAYRHNIPVDPELLCSSRRRIDRCYNPRCVSEGSQPTRESGDGLSSEWASRSPHDGRTIRSTNHPRPALTDWPPVRRFGTSLLTFPDDEIGWLAPAVALEDSVSCASIRLTWCSPSAPPFTCHLIAQALKSLGLASSGSQTFATPGREPCVGASEGPCRAHRWLEQMTINRADAVILNTPELLKELEWYGPTIAAKFHVVANGYDAEMLERYAKQLLAPGGPSSRPHTRRNALLAQGTRYRSSRRSRPVIAMALYSLRIGAPATRGQDSKPVRRLRRRSSVWQLYPYLK